MMIQSRYISYRSSLIWRVLYGRGCASRSPEASQIQVGRVKAICDLARLASGIIVVISVFNSILNNVFSFVYGMAVSFVYGMAGVTMTL